MVSLSFVTAYQWKSSKIMFSLKCKCKKSSFLNDIVNYAIYGKNDHNLHS